MVKKDLEREEEFWNSFENFARSFSEEELEKMKEENPKLYELIMSLIWE